MKAVQCTWGGDLVVGPDGDIAIAPVNIELPQRLVRRLLTNPGDYIWHTDFGAGLGGFVGQPYTPNHIENLVVNQLLFEPLVARDPAPAVQVGNVANEISAATSLNISYLTADLSTNGSVSTTLGG